jgi:acetoin utilization protein AcuB
MSSAIDYVQHDLPFLRKSYDVVEALGLMDYYRLSHLPVVEDNRFIGIVAEEDLLNQDSEELENDRFEIPLLRHYAQPGDHLFDVLRKTVEYRLSLIPVVDDEAKYFGSISQPVMLSALTKMMSLSMEGATIVLDVRSYDYSLQQISRIVEEHEAKVVGLAVEYQPDGSLKIHIRTNVQDLNRIRHSFERFGYEVAQVFQADKYNEDLHDRYRELMRYFDLK